MAVTRIGAQSRAWQAERGSREWSGGAVSGPRGAVGGAAEWEAPITVAELVNGGPLAGARMYGAGESPVHQVRIVDELAVFSSVAPHTAVVLIGAAASGGWAVEMAMRRGPGSRRRPA
ncbi:hypothetical protein GCM10020219_055400 [Nonomuraea dietziae]